jgi:thiol-disulfide isomerase/thioredoxin
MNRSNIITLICIIVIIILAGCITYAVKQKNSKSTMNASEAGVALKTQVGASAYTDIEGNPVALDDFLGKVLIVNSWASWSPFGAKELPSLAKLGEEFADTEVQVLAINRAEPGTTAQAFLNSIEATDGLLLILDPDDRYYESIGGFSMPETVFYDVDGNISFHKRGFMTYEEMRGYTQDALNKE